METRLGRIKAQLLQQFDTISPELIELINKNINPPTPVEKDDVYVRAMYIVSDQINSFGGCFPAEEHARLAELLVDSPVMVGHRKDSLPIARNFYARPEQKDSRNWIKSYFYWLKSARGAEDLKENIDGGIYKECSIGFTYLFPECSVCGRDIRSCRHEPFGDYPVGGRTVRCHFNYRQIERVLETSLVYRGALPDTEISRELKIEKKVAEFSPAAVLEEISAPAAIENVGDNDQFLLVPRYETIPVAASFANDRLTLVREDGRALAEEFAARFPLGRVKKESGPITVPGRLVGYRGKERCRVKYLEKFLGDASGPITRVELKLFPHNSLQLDDDPENKSPFDIRRIPYCISDIGQLSRLAAKIGTRAGVEVWPLDDSRPARKGYLFRPDKNELKTPPSYGLKTAENETDCYLTLYREGSEDKFVIHQFNPERLNKGKWFIADKADNGSDIDSAVKRAEKTDGRMESCEQVEDGLRMTLTGRLEGNFVLRPVRLEGRRRFLFYRLIDN